MLHVGAHLRDVSTELHRRVWEALGWMEGWPPLFPDASVRGETENIASDVDSLARTQPTSLN